MKKVIRLIILAQLIKIRCERIKAMKILKKKIEEKGAHPFEFIFPNLEKYECDFLDLDIESIFPESNYT